jgi:hypothetical protein
MGSTAARAQDARDVVHPQAGRNCCVTAF